MILRVPPPALDKMSPRPQDRWQHPTITGDHAQFFATHILCHLPEGFGATVAIVAGGHVEWLSLECSVSQDIERFPSV